MKKTPAGYEYLWDETTMTFARTAYSWHRILIIMQIALVAYLVISGLMNIFGYKLNNVITRNLGFWMDLPEDKLRKAGIIKIFLAIGLLLPVLFGLSHIITLVFLVATIAFFIFQEKILTTYKFQGLIFRYAVMVVSAISFAYTTWAGADILAEGKDIITRMRTNWDLELEWQAKSDQNSPKVGQIAPDFTLKDTEGNSITLSSFRGKKPVAMVFGSYT